MARLPSGLNKHKICVICEGFEDDAYFRRLMELSVWNENYEFFPINAKSASNIFARYQDAYSNDKFEIVLIFCDTDKAPHREYSQIVAKINTHHANSTAAKEIIMFANPCTMQIILSHFGDVDLKNQGKKTNSSTIFDLTGIENYDAHEEQINQLCSKIFRRSYPQMKDRIAKINLGDNISGSTNFIVFCERFEDDNVDWIQALNTRLNSVC